MNAPEVKFRSFEAQILFFNNMYKLPVAPYPSLAAVVTHERDKAAATRGQDNPLGVKEAIERRLLAFRKTVADELNEVDEIIAQMRDGMKEDGTEYTIEDLLTDLADWLHDIQIYCASEAAKFGIPDKESKEIIMASNFSKMGPDGKPIYDEHGKVLKGPGYWKPEPQLKAMIQERIADHIEVTSAQNGIVWRGNE